MSGPDGTHLSILGTPELRRSAFPRRESGHFASIVSLKDPALSVPTSFRNVFAKVGNIPKATHMQRAPSPELWLMWGTFAGTLVDVSDVLENVALQVHQPLPNFA